MAPQEIMSNSESNGVETNGMMTIKSNDDDNDGDDVNGKDDSSDCLLNRSIQGLDVGSIRSGDGVDSNLSQASSSSPHSSSQSSGISHSTQTTQKDSFISSKTRILLVVAFLLLAVMIPFLVYFYIRTDQYNKFVSLYDSLSSQLVLEFENKLGSMLLGYDKLSVRMTSYARTTSSTVNNDTWPFVTIPDIDFLGASTLSLTSTLALAIGHMVDWESRDAWEQYVVNNIDWAWDAMERSGAESLNTILDRRVLNDDVGTPANFSLGYSQEIYTVDTNQQVLAVVDESSGPYLPTWQSYPVQNLLVNFNQYTAQLDGTPLPTELPVISPVQNLSLYDPGIAVNRISTISTLLQNFATSTGGGDASVEYNGEPISTLVYPIFNSFEEGRKLVAQISATIYWQFFFEDILPEGSEGLLAVVENGCGDVFTFEINGGTATFLGHGDFHNKEYDDIVDVVVYNFSDVSKAKKFTISQTLLELDDDFCPYSFRVHPSETFHANSFTSESWIPAIITFAGFIIVALVVSSYDCVARKRVRKVVQTEQAAKRILSMHFPANVRDRLLGRTKISTRKTLAHPKARIKTFLDSSSPTGDDNKNGTSGEEDLRFLSEAPIADLFLHCTVLFADISGFSAWSSEREPEQVFILLESIFQNFDKQAKKLGVFKVETIADTYVAATGLPVPQSDHAVRMTQFARECLSKANAVVNYLERILGPGTSDLQFRFGIHSGQVTAGVLKGEKTRFQLFGDTVNTAARIESTGEGNKIHLSETTAQALVEAGKEEWTTPRLDSVNIKGKGVVKSFWALHDVQDDDKKCRRSSMQSSSGSSDGRLSDNEYENEEEDAKATDFTDEKNLWGEKEGNNAGFALPKGSKVSKTQRLVDWLLVLLKSQLKQVIAQRQSKQITMKRPGTMYPPKPTGEAGTVIDEVVEAFIMPRFDRRRVRQMVDPDSVELSPEVLSQLREFIEAIANMYRDNPFHCFEHASHVTMSAAKLMSRIVAPEDVDYNEGNIGSVMNEIHQYTYGITSDALAQFAILFSCLCHDVDHRGVPNGQLEVEAPALGETYQHRSIAEQNSVDLSWNLLMEPQYKDLKECICPDKNDEIRFRIYTVNLILATDIFEPQMKELRQERWQKAFANDTSSLPSDSVSVVSSMTKFQEAEAANLKATIVLEHIIQASDVSHCLQHWKVYTKWNEKLFNEMYLAYELGRAEKDPSIGWYKGEIWFYDNYVIPLAEKLDQCCVFGVSSDEMFNYALENRKEWELKGEAIVREMADRYKKRKNLEVGGFTPEEINSFTAKELEHLLQSLIKKGRAFGSLKEDKEGQRCAAQAWIDALEIHERCPASSKLKDPTLTFPIFSGLAIYLKGRKIFQDSDCQFESNMVTKYVKDAEKLGDPVHHSRALALKCDVLVNVHRYDDALETVEKIKKIYDPSKHTESMCKSYGGDRAAQGVAQAALWHHAKGDVENSIKACDYILTNIFPHMDPKNILNSNELLLPIIRIRSFNGEVKEMWKLYEENVIDKYYEYEVKFTPCQQLFKPIKALMGLWMDPDNVPDFDEIVDWLLEDGSGDMHEMMENLYTRMCGWNPSDILADLCLRAAKKLISLEGDKSKIKRIVQKGVSRAKIAEMYIKDRDGNVLWPVANEVHEPLASELYQLAIDIGVACGNESDLSDKKESSEKTQTPLQTSFGAVWLV